MGTGEHHLSVEQKELVAIGASVGAGCHPCTDHHIQAAHQAGLADDRLLAAVTNAEQVAAEAEQQMATHARAQLAAEATPMAAGPIDDELASIGTALGANDWANIERHIETAVALGVSRTQLQDAIEIGGVVQRNAARIHREKAERLLDRLASAPA